ncbi:GTPase-activating protein gyp8 [Rhodotorula kratochvilovae]
MQAAEAAVQTRTAEQVETPTAPEASTSSSATSPQATVPTLTRRERILEAVERADKSALRQLAAEADGFEHTELRKRAWPILLGCDVKGKQRAFEDNDPLDAAAALAALPAREDERQVRLDIVRSLVNYPNDVEDEDREDLRVKLETAILTVLRRYPALHYFQGYHDIVSILLLTLEEDDLVIATAEQLSLHRIRDNMGSGLEPTLGYLRLVDRIVQHADSDLYRITNQAASMPFFALSWALTLFSHDLESVAVIARLFDFLLAHNPVMICYLVVAILLTKKDDLVAVASSCEDDPAMIHSALSQLPHIVLQHPPPPKAPPPAPSEADTEEDLMSSASFLGSSSTLNLDFARSPSFSATSDSELDESLISTSELPSPRGRGRLSLSTSWASAGLDDDDDDDLHSFSESMFSDPDIDGPAFAPFPPTSSASRSRSRTPSPPRRMSRSGHVYLPSPTSPQKPPPRVVLASDLIASALALYAAHPPLGSEGERGIKADEVLGPKSCVFTYALSEEGSLSDAQAEEIVALGVDIVLPEAPPTPPDAAEEHEEEGGFEIVDKPRRRRSSFPTSAAAAAAAKLNLGPHGWLVVGGVAIAGAAVALGVYNGGAGVLPGLGGTGLARGGGLGTAGVGLGAGGGTPQGSPAMGGAGFVVDAGGRLV